MTEDGTFIVHKLIELTPEVSITLKDGIYDIGKSMIHNFVLKEEMKIVFNNLYLYFTGNGGYDMNKGIYLYGEYGVGKTITMSIFSRFLATFFPFSSNGYGIASAEKIAETYRADGNISKYGRNTGDDKPFNLCINEFGKPIDEKYYGTNIQYVINSMLMSRYEIFQEKKILTHATSNFHPSKLDCFDNALLDRFKEMFNFIELKGYSFRR